MSRNPQIGLTFLLLTALFFVSSPAAVRADDSSQRAEIAAQRVAEVAEQLVAAMSDDALDAQTRRARIEDLMERTLDIPAITDFALGRHRSKLSAAERLRFEEVFGDYVVATYARHVTSRSIETVEVAQSRQMTENTAAVSTCVAQTEGPALTWTWRLYAGNNGYRVVDLQTRDVSLAVTYRQHIGAAFKETGFDSVIAMLKDQLEADTTLPQDRAALERLFGKPPDVATLTVK